MRPTRKTVSERCNGVVAALAETVQFLRVVVDTLLPDSQDISSRLNLILQVLPQYLDVAAVKRVVAEYRDLTDGETIETTEVENNGISESGQSAAPVGESVPAAGSPFSSV